MIEEAKKRMDMNLARLSRSSRFDPLQVSSELFFTEIEVFFFFFFCVLFFVFWTSCALIFEYMDFRIQV
jgi:hypothetical protein